MLDRWEFGWEDGVRPALYSPPNCGNGLSGPISSGLDAVVEADLTPVLHLDQDWTRDLARLRDLPVKKCILNPDGMTNMREFRNAAGDHMATIGDVPASVFAAGTPEDIRNYVRDLVNLFDSRGLILCPGCDAPINTKPSFFFLVTNAFKSIIFSYFIHFVADELDFLPTRSKSGNLLSV